MDVAEVSTVIAHWGHHRRTSRGVPHRRGVAPTRQPVAARAGIVVGDLIIRIGDRAVATVDDLQDALEQSGDDATVVALVRGSDDLTVTVDFAPPAAG